MSERLCARLLTPLEPLSDGLLGWDRASRGPRRPERHLTQGAAYGCHTPLIVVVVGRPEASADPLSQRLRRPEQPGRPFELVPSPIHTCQAFQTRRDAMLVAQIAPDRQTLLRASPRSAQVTPMKS